jgi:hypothetical protein
MVAIENSWCDRVADRRESVTKHLLLVDYENIPKIDMAMLDESYRAVVFVGAAQDPRKAARNINTAHRFRRVEFQKISGQGKNALDFHIAFLLGRIFETEPETVCIVVSGDKGFDPLVTYINSKNMQCRRATSFAELVPILVEDPTRFDCDRCHKANTIDHNGGRWCPLCGEFVRPPDPGLTSSPRASGDIGDASFSTHGSGHTCGWCYQRVDMSDGIYDDGEWMCGGCIAEYVD